MAEAVAVSRGPRELLSRWTAGRRAPTFFAGPGALSRMGIRTGHGPCRFHSAWYALAPVSDGSARMSCRSPRLGWTALRVFSFFGSRSENIVAMNGVGGQVPVRRSPPAAVNDPDYCF